MFEKEAEMEFQKLPLKEREKLVSVVQAWNKAFVSGANFGFQKCAKSRLNITTISDAPIDALNENKKLIKAKELLKQWFQTSLNNSCDNIALISETEKFLKEKRDGV